MDRLTLVGSNPVGKFGTDPVGLTVPIVPEGETALTHADRLTSSRAAAHQAGARLLPGFESTVLYQTMFPPWFQSLTCHRSETRSEYEPVPPP